MVNSKAVTTFLVIFLILWVIQAITSAVRIFYINRYKFMNLDEKGFDMTMKKDDGTSTKAKDIPTIADYVLNWPGILAYYTARGATIAVDKLVYMCSHGKKYIMSSKTRNIQQQATAESAKQLGGFDKRMSEANFNNPIKYNEWMNNLKNGEYINKPFEKHPVSTGGWTTSNY